VPRDQPRWATSLLTRPGPTDRLPLPGYHDATTAAEHRARCLIQAGSDQYLPLDFHSFRRAYNTGPAGSQASTCRRR
jgi:hypothetical protein